MPFSLPVLATPLAIVRLPVDDGLPWWAASSTLLSLTRTPDETSIVCDEDRVPASVVAARGYRALCVAGRIPLDAIGVLAWLATPLAAARVPIFVISTFDTDYILVPGAQLDIAIKVLQEAGHSVKMGSESI
jgi:hypothetical protein